MLNNFSPKNLAFIRQFVGEKIVDSDRPQMTIWRVRIACWIPNVRDRLPEYVIIIAFPLQQWLRERASMLRYAYIVRLINADG